MEDDLKELTSEVEEILGTLEDLKIESRHEKLQAHQLVEALEESLHSFEEEQLGEFSATEHQG